MTCVLVHRLNRLQLPRRCMLAVVCVLLGACGAQTDAESPVPDTSATSASGTDTAADNGAADSGDFDLRVLPTRLVVTEGEPDGLEIPLEIVRSAGFDATVLLDLAGESVDYPGLSTRFSRDELDGDTDSSTLTVRLAIGSAPRLPGTVDLVITAGSAGSSDSETLEVSVQPVDAPDVYLLVGQSNMVGFSGDGTRQSAVGEPDAPDPRIHQLHVTANDRMKHFARSRDFTARAQNVTEPALITALDPLHIPYESDTKSKDDAYIGLGLSFAKAALDRTTANIVLVPAAWSGTSFCRNDTQWIGHWNARASRDPDLGDTLLFERAVARTNIALKESGGILRGILWHQGESDANERCVASYAANLELLVQELRRQIDVDAAGAAMRGADAPIPFVIGTMSRGSDTRGDLSDYTPEKQQIDDVHRLLAETLPYTSLSNHDDLIPANGYPCGNTSCIHFGAAALREMGVRYYHALSEAAERKPAIVE